MATRARPNVAVGSEPTSRNRSTIVLFSSPGNNKSASMKAKEGMGSVQRVPNVAGEMTRRESKSDILR